MLIKYLFNERFVVYPYTMDDKPGLKFIDRKRNEMQFVYKMDDAIGEAETILENEANAR